MFKNISRKQFRLKQLAAYTLYSEQTFIGRTHKPRIEKKKEKTKFQKMIVKHSLDAE